MLFIYMDKFLESNNWNQNFKRILIYAKIRIFCNSNFRGKNGKNMLFTQILHVNCSKLHWNWYQCTGNLLLSNMTPNSLSFDNVFRCYLENTIIRKKGSHFGRSLGFRGDRSQISRAHLWNIISDEIIFQKIKVCLVCKEVAVKTLFPDFGSPLRN